jgi:hypothetical protein
MSDSSYNTNDKITAIGWNGQHFLLTARDEITDGSFSYAYSSDGVLWTKSNFYPTVTTQNPYSVKFLGDKFVITGNLISSSLNASGNTIAQNCIIDIVDGQYPVTIPTNLTGNTIVYDIECNLEQHHRIIFPRTTALVVGNTIAYTVNQGNTWTNIVNSPFSNVVNDAVWNGKLWVAVGDGTTNTISTSLDGINWIGRGNYIFSSSCNGVDWSPQQNIFMAVGSGTNMVAKSMDGIYWIGTNTTLFSFGGNDIKWNGDIWVAVGTSSGNTIAYSLDAISWEYSPVSFQSSGSRLYYDGTIWTAYGSDPSYNIATSLDGITWELSYVSGANELMITMPTGLFADPSLNIYPSFEYPIKECGTLSVINKYVHNNSDRGCVQIQPISIACGSGSHSIAYSVDGIKWFAVKNSLFSHCNRAIWNGSLWVAVGQGAYWVATSPDGLNWTGRNSVLMSECYDIAWNGIVFVAVGVGSSLMATSRDGITWTSVSINSTFSVSIHSINWTGRVWLAYGEGINTTAISSYLDASVWTPTPTPNLCVIDCYDFLIGGLVDSSASSYQGSDIPENAFDMSFNETSTKWSSEGSNYDNSGNYVGSNVTGDISGEWLQVNLNGSYACSSYYVIFSVVDGTAIPRSWSFLGSSDGSSWDVVDTFNYGTLTPPNNSWKYPFICLPLDINPLQVANYSYYRIVFTSNFGAGNVSVAELVLFNSGEQQSTLHIRPVILKDLILHPSRILSVDGTILNIYKITDLSCNLIRSSVVHNGQYVNNIMYGLTTEPSATVFDGENHLVLSTNGEISYISNSASNTNLNFDNSMNGVSILGINSGIRAACYNGNFILIDSSYGVLNENVPPLFYSNNLSSLFTTINGLASNSGYGFVVSPNRIYLNDNEQLSLITPKFYDSALFSNTSISFNVYKSTE